MKLSFKTSTDVEETSPLHFMAKSIQVSAMNFKSTSSDWFSGAKRKRDTSAEMPR